MSPVANTPLLMWILTRLAVATFALQPDVWYRVGAVADADSHLLTFTAGQRVVSQHWCAYIAVHLWCILDLVKHLTT